MMVKFGPKGYDSIADYYDNYLFGRTPEQVRQADRERSDRNRYEQEKVDNKTRGMGCNG